MSRLDVVVADGGRVISYVVEGLRTEMRRSRVDEVIIVSRWLSLQDVAVVEHHHLFSPELFALGSHVGLNAAQTASSWLSADIVERQIVAVDIAGGDETQMHFAVAGLHTQDRQHEKEK